MFVPMSSPRASLFPPCAFPVFVCLCHVPSCCCPCGLLLLPVSPLLTCSSSSPGLFVGLVFLLCPVHSPCLVHLCLIGLVLLTCPSLSVVCVCVYIVHVFLFLVASL